MIAVIEGHKNVTHCFKISVGIGSRGHVDDFIDMTNFKISSELRVVKFEKLDDKFVGWIHW